MSRHGKFKGCCGSVLMEFVLVAPLYFALLGGLFFVGELTLNRVRMHIGDHTGTWLGATRLMWSPVDSDGESLKGNAIAKLLQEKLFFETMELTGRIWVDQVQDAGKINSFMAMYKGGVDKLSVSLPDWARGMLFMQDAVSDQDMTELMTKQSYTYFSDGNDSFRAFSFHRFAPLYEGDTPWNPGTGIAGDRADSAVNLVDGVLANIIPSKWICNASDDDGVSTEAASSAQTNNEPYNRQLSDFGE